MSPETDTNADANAETDVDEATAGTDVDTTVDQGASGPVTARDIDETVPVQGNPDRVDAFKAEIEDMKLKASGAEGERRLLGLGLLLTAAGLALAIYGAIEVVNAGDSAADQRAFMASGTLLGIALVIAGAALFVRYSLSRYMRFWLIRMIHESRTNTDRIVDAIGARDNDSARG
jgi:hypothetical protein